MVREAETKHRNSPGICLKLLQFVIKHLSFYSPRAVASGSSRSEASRSVCHEDYSEVAIEQVQRRIQEEEEDDKKKKKMRKMNGEAQEHEKAEEEKVAGRKKLTAMAKKGSRTKEKLRFEPNIDERSGKFIKKRKESFSS